MATYERLAVLPTLPAALARLAELAYNLWWSWEPEAQALYADLDADLWESTNHNPVRLLHHVAQAALERAAEDPAYVARLGEVLTQFDAYMDPASSTWYQRTHGEDRPRLIAYFSAEFGLHEALPIYSGGLGVLSGDHCKAASDLGLPFIGVGFLYPQGYFTQHIDPHGNQLAEYEKIDFAEVPARPALDQDGQEVLISVDLPGRTVYAKIWRIQVGRIPIFLMDTDVPRNAPQDRELSARLYGGDREMRISQEVVLGIGGVRAVLALGYEPTVWHMNEGHSAFLGLERVRMMVQDHGLTFDEAVEACRANTLFTTHTPVPAGNDAFAFELVDKFFWQYWGQLGIDQNRFMGFAAQELPWGPQYSMTVLALRLSGYANGVSELHGHVSRKMWSFLWENTPADEIPIQSITNGVHTKTWLAQELRNLYSRHLPSDWLEYAEESQTWQATDEIPDNELWQVHVERKAKLVTFVRDRLRRQYLRHGEGPQRVRSVNHVLDPNALTIGFARRFATYKRATLLFRDLDRLKALVNDPERPLQLIFSGKAHPADEPGKALIREVFELSQDPELAGKIVFVENYDMNVARHLISGVDLWLNTPRRPREASGTSGQKAALSGVPNFSILDGWWDEGYDGANGWSVGEEREYKDSETQDAADADSLYATLQDEIVPLYYARDEAGVPHGWVQVMKNAIRTCAPRFSMRRMVIDYAEQYYVVADACGRRYLADDFAVARTMSARRTKLLARWPGVRVEWIPLEAGRTQVGQGVQVHAKVWLDGIEPADVAVEVVTGRLGEDDDLLDAVLSPMVVVGRDHDAYRYSAEIRPQRSGPLTLGIRVRASHPDQLHPVEPGLVKWA